jgi:endo-1,4-beta-xylanase
MVKLPFKQDDGMSDAPEAFQPPVGEQLEPEIHRRAMLKLLIAGGSVLAAAGCGLWGDKDEPTPDKTSQVTNGAERGMTGEVNMISKGDWSHMSGVNPKDGALEVRHTGLALRKVQEDWDDAEVPEYSRITPVNPWTHVRLSEEAGDVGIAAKLSNIQGKATLLFQGDPTFRYDERVFQHAGIGVEVEGNKVTANVWFGTGEAADVTKSVELDGTGDVEIGCVQEDNTITITANGKTITVPDARVFESGSIWFGMDATDSWQLAEMHARGFGDTQVEVVTSAGRNFGELSPSGLQAMVAKTRPDLIVGSAIDLIPLTYDETYAQLVMSQCGGLATEMLAKPQNIQPQKDQFNWADFDAFVELAKRHGKKIHGHTPVFGEANPAWMEDAVANGSRTEALRIMREQIKAVVSRHKGEIATWDIVNEPFDEHDWAKLRPHLWQRSIGDSYIEAAFRAGHEADLDALLFLNDWGFEHDPDRWEALIDLLKDLKSKDVPIHGIGFQAHLDPDDINELLSTNILADRFKQLEEMGLKVRVSEISVEGEDSGLQAKAYAKVMRTCMNAKNCIGFTMWGLASNETYFTSEPNGDYEIDAASYGNDAPWQKNQDGSYTRKAAANALFSATI